MYIVLVTVCARSNVHSFARLSLADGFLDSTDVSFQRNITRSFSYTAKVKVLGINLHYNHQRVFYYTSTNKDHIPCVCARAQLCYDTTRIVLAYRTVSRASYEAIYKPCGEILAVVRD